MCAVSSSSAPVVLMSSLANLRKEKYNFKTKYGKTDPKLLYVSTLISIGVK